VVGHAAIDAGTVARIVKARAVPAMARRARDGPASAQSGEAHGLGEISAVSACNLAE
jgi:hypothetical protein